MVLAKVAKETPDLVSESLYILKELFPNVFSENKIDFDKLRTFLGNEIDTGPERFTFSWSGKRNAINILQMPTRATLVPIMQEHYDFDNSENIFIEGDNLEVLKLLYKSYFGKIRMIYIDPPYNTGGDFIYRDDYSDPLDTYLRMTQQKDDEGNVLTAKLEKTGRFHSVWLSMMYPRLFLARQLLSEDGTIFISVDDHEVSQLRLLMNEVFGEESFIGQFIWKSRQNKDNRNVTNASIDHEYVLCYGKQIRGSTRKRERYSNPDNDPRGDWTSENMVGLLSEQQRPNLHFDLINPETGINYGRPKMGWRYDKGTLDRLTKEKKIIWPSSSNGRPRRKKFLHESKREFTGFSSVIGEGIFTTDGTAEAEELFGARIIEFPKPVELLKQLVQQGTDNGNDIVLDFFAGSSSTAQAVLELNREDGGKRRFIMIQLQELTPYDSLARKCRYNNIADIGKERIRRVIRKIEKEQMNRLKFTDVETHDNLGFRVFRLAESNYKRWRGVEEKNPEKYVEEMTSYLDSLNKGWKRENVIYEILIKEGLSLTSRIERKKEFKDNQIWSVKDSQSDRSLMICLDEKVRKQTIKDLGAQKNVIFICRDVALDDSSAANLGLNCRLKTI